MGRTTELAEKQRRALAALKALPALSRFYLAGGTAIAHHLHHRRSNDLDLFSLDPSADLDAVAAQVKALPEAEMIASTDVMIKLRIEGEPIDVVRYRYPPLEPPLAGPEGVPVAGLLDLATMKLGAISGRGIRRDFWDLHEILTRASVTLDAALDGYLRRFGVSESDLYHVLRSLTYYDDAERELVYPAGLAQDHWEAIKAYFRTEAPRSLRERGR